MVEYKCFRCGYITHHKGSLVNHLKRKNICNPILNDISIENIKNFYGFCVSPKQHPNDTQTTPKQHPNDTFCIKNTTPKTTPKQHLNDTQFEQKQHPNDTQTTPKWVSRTCQFCNKTFTRKSGLKKHLNICLLKKNDDNLKDKKIDELIKNQKENENLKEIVEKLLLTNNTTNNTTNNNNYNTTNTNSNNTINNTININNYGSENTKYITKDFILNLLEKPYSAIPELIKYTHFNDEHPENHNIKITNKKDPFVKVLKNDKWELASRKDTISDLIDQKHLVLNDNYIKKDIKNIDRLELFNKKYINDDKDLINKLYKESELIILNNS